MADRYYNPFQSIDISVPLEFHKEFSRYCRAQGNENVVIDESPFPRMIDLWFLAVCIACRLGLEPTDITEFGTKKKIISGSIFSSDPWRVDLLMLIAISKAGDVQVVSQPRKMMSIASGLAVAGLPKVIAMLKEGDGEPIWNLSEAVFELLTKS